MADVEEKSHSIWDYVYNSEDGKLLGRTPIRWLMLCAFFVCLYTCLFAFIMLCLTVFFETLDTTVPKWYGEQSLTQNNPGLGMRPLPQYDSTLIRFQQGKPSSYKPYTDHLEAFLLQYENELTIGRNLKECSITPGFTKSEDMACRFDVDKILGSSDCTKQKDFGYEDGQPCILLKMNRVFDFTPKPYETLEELLDDNDLSQAPRFLSFTPNLTIAIGCEGENPADRENLLDGGIEFYPNEEDNGYSGLPVAFFPFKNQEGYRSPFVMMKVRKFNRRVVIQMVCTLYAKNIVNIGTPRRHGVMKFELLKD